MKTYNTILLEHKEEGYVMITMNRPGELNALSKDMRLELTDCFTHLEGDTSVKTIILTGGDYVFSAGGDIKELSALPDSEIEAYFRSIFVCLRRISLFPKPVIAAVNGIAIGGGFNLAVVCDLIVASETAIFGHPELKLGLNPLFNPIRGLVGMAKAKEIALLGEPIPANEALRIGLVNKVVPPERLMMEVEGMAKEISRRSAKATEIVKKISSMVPHLEVGAALALEFELSTFLFSRPERKTYMREFLISEEMRKRKRRPSI